MSEHILNYINKIKNEKEKKFILNIFLLIQNNNFYTHKKEIENYPDEKINYDLTGIYKTILKDLKKININYQTILIVIVFCMCNHNTHNNLIHLLTFENYDDLIKEMDHIEISNWSTTVYLTKEYEELLKSYN